jgi:hypothetical protein
MFAEITLSRFVVTVRNGSHTNRHATASMAGTLKLQVAWVCRVTTDWTNEFSAGLTGQISKTVGGNAVWAVWLPFHVSQDRL